MEFSDIHIHALSGVDDGARSEEEMYAMIDAAYRDGARMICLTPHFHPGYFGHNAEKVEQKYRTLCMNCTKKYTDLELCLGNEMRYDKNCVSWLREGICRTMNDTRYVLVDFSDEEEEKTIVTAMEQLLNAGYIPILAHAERYRRLDGRLKRLREFHGNGVLLQVDVQSLQGEFGRTQLKKSRALLTERLVDLVSSDAHNLNIRPPGLKRGYQLVADKYGTGYADAIFMENAHRLLQGDLHERSL